MNVSTLKPCEAFVAQVGARATGGLDEPGGAALEAHLAGGCAGCAALAAELDAELDLARLPEEEPAPGGWERVLLRLDGAAPAAPDAPAPVVRLRCAYCRDDLRRAEAACCASCLAPHHPDCFAEHGRCAAPGCGETRALSAGAAPASAPTRPARPRLRLLLGLVVGAGGVAALAGLAEVSRRGELASRARADQRAAERVLEMQRLLAEYQAAERPQVTPEPTFDGKPLSHWIQVLADRSQAYRDGAIVALQAMGDAAVPALLQALEAENVVQRRSAALVLRGVRAPQAVPALVRRSRDDPDTEVRVGAVHALVGVAQGASGEVQEAALAGLTRAAQDPQREVRWAAVEAAAGLERLPGTQALWRASLHGDAEFHLRSRAAESLATRLESPVQPDAEPLQALLLALRADPHPEVRREIAKLLGKGPLKEGPAQASIADALARALADAAPKVREQAVRSLESFDLAPRHLEALLEALPDTPLAAELLRRVSCEGLAQLVPGLGQRSEAVQGEFLRMLHPFPWRGDESTVLFDALAGYLPQAPSPELRVWAAGVLDNASQGRPDRRARGQEAVRVVEGDVASVLSATPLPEDPLPAWIAIELARKLGTSARAAAPGLAAIVRCRELTDERRGQALAALVAVAPVDSSTEAAVVEALQAGTGDVLAGQALLAVAQAPDGALQGEACRKALLQRAPVWLARDEAPSRGTRPNLLRALVHIDPTPEELRPLERLLRSLPDAETKQDGSVVVLEKQALLSRLR